MDDQPFRKWGSRRTGPIAAFGLLIVVGIAGVLYNYWLKTQITFTPDSGLLAFTLYGGIAAIVAGIVGLIATSGA